MERTDLRKARVEIDLDALDYNIQNIKEKVGDNVQIAAVVKADSYGHGSVECAKELKKNGISLFAVATVEEALLLRESGIDDDIMLLGIVPESAAYAVAKYDIMPAFTELSTAKAISDEAVKLNKKIGCVIPLDTGMGRIGFQIKNETENQAAIKRIQEINALEGVYVKCIFSHFAVADEFDRSYSELQLAYFDKFIQDLDNAGIKIELKMLCNSAGVMEYPEASYDAVRPGIIMYGIYPSDEVHFENINIKPLMSVKANIVYIKTVPPGTDIGYGRKFTAERETVVATIPIGYADGYTRRLNGKAEMIVRGQKVPVIGSICMDQCMIDVTDVPDVQLDDEVIILGTDGNLSITAEDMAKATGTIPHEILCSFSLRMPKMYKGGIK